MKSDEKKTVSAKRDHLMATAFELFNEGGYHAVGIDTVLARAGVAKMTLYNHFASKEELIAAVLAKHAEEISADLGRVIEQAGSDAEQRLLAVFDWLETWFRTPDFRGCIYIKASGEYCRPEDKPRQAAVAFKQACQELLTSLCGQLGLADEARTMILARQLALLMEGSIVLAFVQNRPEAAQDAKAAARVLIAAARQNS